MTVIDFDAIEPAGAMVVRPGDTLIVWIDRRISADDAAMYLSKLRERLPMLADVVVLEATGAAIYRPSTEDPAGGSESNEGDRQ